MKQHHRRFGITAALALLLLAGAQARTWTSADGTKTFEGELHSYDPATGKLAVKLPNGKEMKFQQDKLSADDIAFLKENGKQTAASPSSSGSVKGLPDVLPDPDGNEKNLIQLIKALRKDFNAPSAKFVTASLGQTEKGSKGGDGVILDAMEAVSKSKDPGLKGKVGFVYTHPLSKGGSSSGHYGGNPETYMNVGEAMGKAMVELLKN